LSPLSNVSLIKTFELIGAASHVIQKHQLCLFIHSSRQKVVELGKNEGREQQGRLGGKQSVGAAMVMVLVGVNG
jgi:hypothetical protein